MRFGLLVRVAKRGWHAADHIYLDEEHLQLLKPLAAEESKSVADLVRQVVDQFLRS